MDLHTLSDSFIEAVFNWICQFPKTPLKIEDRLDVLLHPHVINKVLICLVDDTINDVSGDFGNGENLQYFEHLVKIMMQCYTKHNTRFVKLGAYSKVMRTSESFRNRSSEFYSQYLLPKQIYPENNTIVSSSNQLKAMCCVYTELALHCKQQPLAVTLLNFLDEKFKKELEPFSSVNKTVRDTSTISNTSQQDKSLLQLENETSRSKIDYMQMIQRDLENDETLITLTEKLAREQDKTSGLTREVSRLHRDITKSETRSFESSEHYESQFCELQNKCKRLKTRTYDGTKPQVSSSPMSSTTTNANAASLSWENNIFMSLYLKQVLKDTTKTPESLPKAFGEDQFGKFYQL